MSGTQRELDWARGGKYCQKFSTIFFLFSGQRPLLAFLTFDYGISTVFPVWLDRSCLIHLFDRHNIYLSNTSIFIGNCWGSYPSDQASVHNLESLKLDENGTKLSFREAYSYQIGWICGKVPKRKGGNFQSKNLYCRFWVLQTGPFDHEIDTKKIIQGWGYIFSTIVLRKIRMVLISGNHVHTFHTICPSYLLAYM